MSVRLHAERSMSLERRARSRSLAWSNPLAWWWSLLTLVSAINIAAWFSLYHYLQKPRTGGLGSTAGNEVMLLLCAAYVFGCAFRSFLPRADVQRICLFDTWLSSVMIGRSVATVAEVCFAGYLAFLATIDIPMYLTRWRAEVANGSRPLSPLEGLRDASFRWVVTHDIAEWKDEIAWMSLYFSAAVWASLALCVCYCAHGAP